MTFESARRKLARIAKGEYQSIRYDLTTNDKTKSAVCSLYIHGHPFATGETWAQAFKAMDDILNPKKKTADPAEQPGPEEATP